jgi:hypothetical protein
MRTAAAARGSAAAVRQRCGGGAVAGRQWLRRVVISAYNNERGRVLINTVI